MSAAGDVDNTDDADDANDACESYRKLTILTGVDEGLTMLAKSDDTVVESDDELESSCSI